MARVVAAAASAVAVVAATAVMVGSAAADPALASGRQVSARPASPTPAQGQDVVAPTALLPTHADLAADAAALTTPSPARRVAGRLQVKQRYGIDVSWPQCATTLPTIRLDFAVVGLTDGHAESVSPCFADQVAWAKANHLRVAVYVVPNSPGTAASATMRTAAATPCLAADASCPTYAAGVRQAQHAMAAASAAGLPRTGWWLDVEESAAGTLWSDDLVANTALLKGWVDTLRAANLPVGAYSTHGYWTMITGGWDADLPQWVPVGLDGITSAQQACAEPFTSGPVVMTQWLTGPYDGNMLCPSTDGDPLARAFTGKAWATKTTAGAPALLTTPVPHPEIEQAQAEQDAQSDDCGADASGDGSGATKPTKGSSKKRVTDDKKDPKDDPSCGDDSSPTKDPKTKPGSTPKTKAKPKSKAHTGRPKTKSKGKHHRG